jgi:hypothetical protein
MQEEKNKIWKVMFWELRDLSKLKTQLKTEFNANFAGPGATTLLDSSDTPHTKKKGGGQSKLG